MIVKLKRFFELKIKNKIRKFKPTIAAVPLKIWIFSILAFFGEVVLFSKYTETHNGSYTPYQSTIFLITIFVGVIAFLILVLVIALKFSRKLWLKSKILFLFIIALMITSPLGVALLADAKLFNNPNPKQMVQGVQQSMPNFTGQDVFDAVNSYRKSKGVGELSLDKILCNNLAQRYLDIQAGIKEGIAHKGFDEWYEKYVEPYSNYYVEEDFASGNTSQEVIKAWEGSPGHRLSILDKSLTIGCSYAAEGNAVIILGRKQGYLSNANSQQTSSYQNFQQPNNTQTITHDGSRTGPIVDYFELCTGKTIKIYENERIPYKRITGELVYSTKGDIKCYEDQINQLKNQASGVQNQPSTTYTPPQYYSCTICYSTYCSTYNYLYKTKEECDTEQQRINSIFQNTNTPTPQPAAQDQSQVLIDQHNAQVTKCQGDVTYKYQGYLQSCDAYGGSAREGCIQIYTDQRQREYDACGSLY